MSSKTSNKKPNSLAFAGGKTANLAAIYAIFALAVPLHAQDDTAATQEAPPAREAINTEDEAAPEPDEPLRIDLTISIPRGDVNEANARACEEEADAATISGDIIVCRRLGEDNSNYFSGSRDAARKRYAEETQNFGDLPTPDVAGEGIFRGPATVSSLCVIPPCPPPPALIIDVEALPEAPEGSDADRIAHGLPPLGDNELSEEEEKRRRAELGQGSVILPGEPE